MAPLERRTIARKAAFARSFGYLFGRQAADQDFRMTYDPAAFVSTPAEGRSCGTCTLCCKVFDVPSLEKPAGQWCKHCLPGRGCGIHETRPQHCRAFHCMWMTAPWLADEWKPERAKFVLTTDPATLTFRFAAAKLSIRIVDEKSPPKG